MLDAISTLNPIVWLLASAIGYPLYILLMAAVLAVCGVPREDIARWALTQARRQRITDLISAARGLHASPVVPEKSTTSELSKSN